MKLTDTAEIMLGFIMNHNEQNKQNFFSTGCEEDYPHEIDQCSALQELQDKEICSDVKYYIRKGFSCKMKWYKVEEYFKVRDESASKIDNEKITVQNITVNNGQLNMNNGNGVINATQNNNFSFEELKEKINAIKSSIADDLSSDDKDIIHSSLDIIQDELLSNNPNEKNVKAHFNVIKRIDAGVKFASACCSLLTFADKVYPFLSNIIPMFYSAIK